jgi:hypothetical protein
MSKLFLSHSTKDINIAEQVEKFLYKYYIPESVGNIYRCSNKSVNRSGDEFNLEIDTRVFSDKYFFLLLTPNALHSHYVSYEYSRRKAYNEQNNKKNDIICFAPFLFDSIIKNLSENKLYKNLNLVKIITNDINEIRDVLLSLEGYVERKKDPQNNLPIETKVILKDLKKLISYICKTSIVDNICNKSIGNKIFQFIKSTQNTLILDINDCGFNDIKECIEYFDKNLFIQYLIESNEIKEVQDYNTTAISIIK